MRFWRILTVVFVLAGWMGFTSQGAGGGQGPSLAGRLLVAAETLQDLTFTHTVVYLVEHNSDGAVGLIINRAFGKSDLRHLLKGFGFTPAQDEIPVTLHFGGPVASEGLFIIHTPDFVAEGTLKVKQGLHMTGEKSILEAIAAGKGPKRFKVMIGYTGWGPGQLGKEIARGDWLDTESDNDFVFDTKGDGDLKWSQAHDRAGLTL